MMKFICRFRMWCIILEERRKMRKKILDAAILTVFGISLSVTSNIQESVADMTETQKVEAEPAEEDFAEAMMEEASTMELGAGVTVAISANSFTTESDEETGIEKKDVTLVTSSGDSTGELELEEANSEEVETGTELSEDSQLEESLEDSDEAVYSNRWEISLTEEEIDLLAKIVWLEANGEPVEGQEAVVEVVFNRMASDLYPNTLYDVLSQNKPVQFASWKRRDKAQPTEKEYDSIYNVLNGNTDLLRNDTMNFSTYPLTSHLDVKICCHYFCY